MLFYEPVPTGKNSGPSAVGRSGPSASGLSISDVIDAVSQGRAFGGFGSTVGRGLGLGRASNAFGALGFGAGFGTSALDIDTGPIGRGIDQAMSLAGPGAILGGPIGASIGALGGFGAGLAGLNDALAGVTNALGLGAAGYALGGPPGGLIGALIGYLTGKGEGSSGGGTAYGGGDPNEGLGGGAEGGALA